MSAAGDRQSGAAGVTTAAARARDVGPSPLAWALSGVVRLYRLVPRGAVPRCRFTPTCSAYALEALRRHGGARGGWFTARRVMRCHPFHPGGVDEVPAPRPRATPHAKGAHA